MRGLKTLQRGARLVRSRFAQGSIVLLYHRITDEANDPFSMNVSPKRFEEHLDILRRIGQPATLAGLVDSIERGSVASRGIVVTFDDGYLDNLKEAEPLLRRYGIPATVFVTSGLVGRDCECWWDRLARIVLGARRSSAPLRLTIDGTSRVLKPGSPARLLRVGHRLLRTMEERDRSDALEQIARWAEVETVCRPIHRMLSAAELQELAESPMIEIGAHTITHPVLSSLPAAEARRELLGSRIDLERIIERRVTSCALPYGQAQDYSRQTLDLVREAGYRCACTAIADITRRRSDLFQLPRLWVSDWSAEAFTHQVSAWLHA